MRIVQLIDSLEAGGAERMAVNYANALVSQIEFSGLVSTRKEGDLKNQLKQDVSYLCLFKKSSLDKNAIFKLHHYIKKNRITIIHAHSSSFFMAVLLKILQPKVSVIWHDHYGKSDFVEKRPKRSLQIAVFLFNGIIAVNERLKQWSTEVLVCNNVIYLPNFAEKQNEKFKVTFLKGMPEKRLVCLANLRIQKNHLLLLQVAEKLKISHPDWTFHFVGKDFQDAYSNDLRKELAQRKLDNSVFLYGSCSDIEWVLEQSIIALLPSVSEGLPVALLEYGLHKKPVVVTAVGQVGAIVNNGENGFLVPPKNNIEEFYQRLVLLINDVQLQERFGEQLHQKILADFSTEVIIQNYLKWVRTTITNE